MKQQLSVVRLICQASSNPMIPRHQPPTSFDPIYYDKQSTSRLPPNRKLLTPHLLLWTLPLATSTSLLAWSALPSGREIVIVIIVITGVLYSKWQLNGPIENESFDVVVDQGRCEEATIQSNTKKGVQRNEPLHRLHPRNNHRHLIHIAAPCQ